MDDERWDAFRGARGAIRAQSRGARQRRWFDASRAIASPASAAAAAARGPARRRSLQARCALEIDPVDAALDVASVETAVKYAGYLRRQESEIERARRDERRGFRADFPFDRVPGLSREVVQRLSQVRPDTLGQALRIPGVTPAAVAVLSLTSAGRRAERVTSLAFRDRLARRARRSAGAR